MKIVRLQMFPELPFCWPSCHTRLPLPLHVQVQRRNWSRIHSQNALKSTPRMLSEPSHGWLWNLPILVKPGFSSGSTLGEPSDDCFLARLDGTSNAGDTSDTCSTTNQNLSMPISRQQHITPGCGQYAETITHQYKYNKHIDIPVAMVSCRVLGSTNFTPLLPTNIAYMRWFRTS